MLSEDCPVIKPKNKNSDNGQVKPKQANLLDAFSSKISIKMFSPLKTASSDWIQQFEKLYISKNNQVDILIFKELYRHLDSSSRDWHVMYMFGNEGVSWKAYKFDFIEHFNNYYLDKCDVTKL